MKIKKVQLNVNLNTAIKTLVVLNVAMFLVFGASFGVLYGKSINYDSSTRVKEVSAIMGTAKICRGAGIVEGRILQKNIRTAVTKVQENSKIAFLTFDDGPSRNTEKILSTLRKEKINATFFVNGHTDEHSKEMYKLILKYGNVIGNHTYSHDYKYIYSSVTHFERDVNKLNKYVYKLTGKEPLKILRFPGGSNNTVSIRYGGKDIMNKIVKEVKKMGYNYVDWNVDSEDASAMMIPKKRIIQNVLSESRWKKKVVILMHDAAPKKTTAEGLDYIIKSLKKEGYSFDTIDHLKGKIQFLK